MLSITISAVLLGIAPFLPIAFFEKYLSLLSWPINAFGIEKSHLRRMTIFVFGRMTPNYAPIQILLLMAFWSSVSFIIIFFGFNRLFPHKKK